MAGLGSEPSKLIELKEVKPHQATIEAPIIESLTAEASPTLPPWLKKNNEEETDESTNSEK